MDEQKHEPSYWGILIAPVRYDKTLPQGAKILYSEISSLTKEVGYCFASNEYFLNLYGIGERTLQRYLKKLEQGGYIRIEDGDGGKGRRRIYAGLEVSANPVKNDGVNPEPRQKLRGNPAKNDGVNKVSMNNISNKDNPPKAPQGAKRGRRTSPACDWEPAMFERFWTAYPRGEDKAGARREWDKLKPDRELMETMSAALERAKTSDEWLRGIGIPYACRWLRNRRWEDEIKGTPEPEAPERKLVGERC